MSSSRIRQDTPSTARWCTTNASCAVERTPSALSIVPVAGFSRSRACNNASSDKASTQRRQSRASTAPASGTVNDHPSAPVSSARSRNIAWWSSSACSTTVTSASVTAAGTDTTIV